MRARLERKVPGVDTDLGWEPRISSTQAMREVLIGMADGSGGLPGKLPIPNASAACPVACAQGA